jgi:spermidine/putrescine transport system substrate-binding protein
LWGTTAIGYRVDRVEVTPQTWMDFFTHDGPVAWLNDTRTMMSIALRALGFDPNSITTAEIDTAREFLESQASNVYEIANDNGQALLEDGTVDMVIEYNGDIYQLLLDCECEDYAYLIPEEGTIFDLGLLVVPSRAKNPELALAFIDYLHDPYVNAQIMNDSGYATTNQAALESGFITPALLENPIINPDASILERSWTLEDVGDVDFIYIDAWARLRRELGK